MDSTSADGLKTSTSLKAYPFFFFCEEKRTVLLISCWMAKHSFGSAALWRVVYRLEKGFLLDMYWICCNVTEQCQLCSCQKWHQFSPPQRQTLLGVPLMRHTLFLSSTFALWRKRSRRSSGIIFPQNKKDLKKTEPQKVLNNTKVNGQKW